MIDEVYVIKSNGICFAHFKDEIDNPMETDLKSSMLIGLEYGIFETFKNQMICIILKNGKRIHFEEYEIDGYKYKIVIVLEHEEPLAQEFLDKDFEAIHEKVKNFNEFLQNSEYKNTIKGNQIDTNLSDIIKQYFW